MNCDEFKKYLADFLDESLGVERSQEVSDHLAACSLCSEDMASLAECQRLVSGLPIVEPPVGFTAQVMAEVREAANPPSLWERLFLPLRIKIPLQATAAVLIAVLAAYLYQKEPLQREPLVSFQPESSVKKQEEADTLAPSVTRAPITASKTKEVAKEAKPQVEEFKDSALGRDPQPFPRSREQDEGIAKSPARSQDQVRSPATVSPTPPQKKSSETSEAASPRLEQSSPSGEAGGTGAPVSQLEKESASKDAAFARKSSEPLERSVASTLKPLASGTVIGVALPADHELAIRLKEPVRDDKNTLDRLASGRTQTERRSMTLQDGTENLDRAREQAVQTGQSQTVWVTIARNQYELFKKELAEMGNIEVESSTPELKNDATAKSDRLRIKVTILPPPSSRNPAPSQPSSR